MSNPRFEEMSAELQQICPEMHVEMSKKQFELVVDYIDNLDTLEDRFDERINLLHALDSGMVEIGGGSW